MKKLAIFDLDGTLLNTINDIGNACNYALKTMGFATHNITAYRNMVGNGVRNLMEKAQPEADPITIDKLLEYFREYYDVNCTDKTQVYPGIPALIEELIDKDVAIAVASNKYQEATDKIIRHYFPQIDFVAIEGSKPGIPRKPDPSVIFEILSKAKVRKSEVLFIGDSANDIEAARRACVESIGVTWGFRPPSELRRAHANYIVTHPSQILDRLNDEF